MIVSETLGFMLYTFVKHDECVKHETQGHRYYHVMCMYTYIIYSSSLSAWAGCDTRSIFRQSLTDLKSVFLLLLDQMPYQC